MYGQHIYPEGFTPQDKSLRMSLCLGNTSTCIGNTGLWVRRQHGLIVSLFHKFIVVCISGSFFQGSICQVVTFLKPTYLTLLDWQILPSSFSQQVPSLSSLHNQVPQSARDVLSILPKLACMTVAYDLPSISSHRWMWVVTVYTVVSLLLALGHLVDFLSQWYLCPLWHLPIMPASNKSQPLEVNLAAMTMQRSAADQSIQNLQVQVGKPVTQNEHPIWNTWFSAKVGWPSTKPCFDQTVPTSKLFRKPMLASQGYYHGQQSKLTGFLIQVVISWSLPWIQQIPC